MIIPEKIKMHLGVHGHDLGRRLRRMLRVWFPAIERRD
jgi:hypothetical protein